MPCASGRRAEGTVTDAGSDAGCLCSLAPGLIAALRDLGSVWRCRWRRAVPGRAGIMLMEEALSGVGGLAAECSLENGLEGKRARFASSASRSGAIQLLQHPHELLPVGLLPSHPAHALLFPAGLKHLHTSQSSTQPPPCLPQRPDPALPQPAALSVCPRIRRGLYRFPFFFFFSFTVASRPHFHPAFSSESTPQLPPCLLVSRGRRQRQRVTLPALPELG